MKLKQYLSEDNKFLDGLRYIMRNTDTDYLRAVLRTDNAFGRRMDIGRKWWFTDKVTHRNRWPRDTPGNINAWVDEWFKKKFGWKARSENSLFVYNIDIQSGAWNRADYYIIFPRAVRTVIWSEKSRDLYLWLRMGRNLMSDLNKNEVIAKLEAAKYKKGEVAESLKGKSLQERMIHCRKYHGIQTNLFDLYKKTIMGMMEAAVS